MKWRIITLWLIVKYWLWKWYWRIWPPKGHSKIWVEAPLDAGNQAGIAVGRIYSGGGPFGPATKAEFNPRDYGVVAVKTNEKEESEMPEVIESPVFGTSNVPSDDVLEELERMSRRYPVALFALLNKKLNERGFMFSFSSLDEEVE